MGHNRCAVALVLAVTSLVGVQIAGAPSAEAATSSLPKIYSYPKVTFKKSTATTVKVSWNKATS